MSDNGTTEIFSSQEKDELIKDSLNKATAAMKEAARGDALPQKLFGLVTVPAMIAIPAKAVANNLADFISEGLKEHAYSMTMRAGSLANGQLPRLGFAQPIGDGTIQKAAAITTLGTAIVVKSGAFIKPVINALTQQKRAEMALARKLSPILDKKKGGHSLLAYLTTGMNDNSMVYADRKYREKAYNTATVNAIVDLAVNSGTNILLDLSQFGGMWKYGVSPEALTNLRAQQALNPDQAEKTPAQIKWNERKEALMKQGKMVWNTVNAGVAEAIQTSNNTSLTKDRRPFTALQMMLELQEQVSSKADARSFTLPKVKGGRSEPASLESYIAQAIMLHQQELADLDPNHTEIRDALKEDLIDAVKPMAAAVRAGELSVMSVVELIGEGKIVTNKGRGIADTDTILGYIDELRGTVRPKIDIPDYLLQSGVTIKQFKETLNVLEGDERLLIIAMIPHELRKEAGVGEKESQQADHMAVEQYHTHIAHLVAGICARSDEDLRHDGVPSGSIRVLRKLNDNIQSRGVDAVKEAKTTLTHPDGIERHIISLVVPKILEDRTYLGTLLETGREALASAEKHAAAPDERPTSHAEKYGRRRDDTHYDPANDRGSHREREDFRRAAGSDMDREF